jgi:hypothetical protein
VRMMAAFPIDDQGSCRACGRPANDKDHDTQCPATRVPGFAKRGRNRRPRAKAVDIQESLFDDLEPGDRTLVEVDGWPDYAAIVRRKPRKGAAARDDLTA